MEFIIATNNSGKLKDFNILFKGLGHSAVSLDSKNVGLNVSESGTTFAKNAYIKAKYIYELTKSPTIADDSGLCVDALGGRPGVYSARYGGEELNDKERYEKLLLDLSAFPSLERQAHFTCAVCAIIDDNRVIETEGRCEGIILDKPRGENGFGYDPIFYVPKFKKTFAEMTDIEKNSISHRKAAMDKLVKELIKLN